MPVYKDVKDIPFQPDTDLGYRSRRTPFIMIWEEYGEVNSLKLRLSRDYSMTDGAYFDVFDWENDEWNYERMYWNTVKTMIRENNAAFIIQA